MKSHESSRKLEKKMSKKCQKGAEGHDMTYMGIPVGGISPIDGGDVQGAHHE